MKKVPTNLLIGGILVFVVLFTAALSLIWTPHDHALMNISEKFHQPNNIYLLGTDQLGRDILSQLMAEISRQALGNYQELFGCFKNSSSSKVDFLFKIIFLCGYLPNFFIGTE